MTLRRRIEALERLLCGPRVLPLFLAFQQERAERLAALQAMLSTDEDTP